MPACAASCESRPPLWRVRGGEMADRTADTQDRIPDGHRPSAITGGEGRRPAGSSRLSDDAAGQTFSQGMFGGGIGLQKSAVGGAVTGGAASAAAGTATTATAIAR